MPFNPESESGEVRPPDPESEKTELGSQQSKDERVRAWKDPFFREASGVEHAHPAGEYEIPWKDPAWVEEMFIDPGTADTVCPPCIPPPPPLPPMPPPPPPPLPPTILEPACTPTILSGCPIPPPPPTPPTGDGSPGDACPVADTYDFSDGCGPGPGPGGDWFDRGS